jgi:hypothetical protein
MQTIEHEPESGRLDQPFTPEAPRHLLLTLGRIYIEAGLTPADALRSALADFDCYHETSCVA